MNLFVLVSIWTVVIIASFAISSYREYGGAVESARIEARAHFDEVVNVRHWVASLGGIYAPITARTPPNPFLEGRVPERDVVSPQGQSLTLLNPAYVTRLLAENLRKRRDVHERLVSTEPVQDINIADPWEARAIESFVRDNKAEILEIAPREGYDHMRYIAPLYLESVCMGCHEDQGEVGDLRGAISVAIPMEAHYDVARNQVFTLGLFHSGIWAIGLSGIFLFGGKLRTTLGKLRHSERVLNEAQRIAHIGSWALNHETMHLEWSDEIYNMFGISRGEFEATYAAFADRIHPDDRARVHEVYWASVQGKKLYDITHRIIRNDDDSVRYVHEQCEHDHDQHGVVTYSIGTVQDVTASILAEQELKQEIHEHKEAERKIHQLAFTDPFTGMPNEAKFLETLSQAIDRDACGFVASIELSGIGDIVGAFGLEASELIIYETGKRLFDQMNEHSVAARVGPRLFKILYITDDAEEGVLKAAAHHLLQVALKPFDLMGANVFVNAFMGVSIIDPEESTAQSILTDVEIAHYEAEKSATSTLVYFSKSIKEDLVRTTQVVAWLHSAVDNNVFEMFFQPQVNLNTNTVVGCEALIRWPVNSEEWISPGEFIPIAEKSGLIGDITTWTVDESCRLAASWIAEHGLHLRVGVNISAEELASPDFLNYVAKFIEQSNLPPYLLEIEITETALMKDVVMAAKNLRKLRNMGASIAIDDFGTGQASLAYLKNFPIDRLKIDQSFVTGAPTNETDRKIIVSIVQLAHSLGMTVIAEGVEKEEHIKLLASLGCDEVQGYHIAKPMPSDQFMTFVKAYK